MIPPEANAAFVAAMENTLEVYKRRRNAKRPLVCLDETSKQLVAETRQPLPMLPGRPARFDYEYKRNGTANAFMLFAPLEGWRQVKITERRTAFDYAQVRALSAEVLQKLQLVHPQTVDQAQRILGITPAAISLLLVHLARGQRGAA